MTLIRRESVNITHVSNETNTYSINQGEITGYALLLVIVLIVLFYVFHNLKKNVKNKIKMIYMLLIHSWCE